MDAEVDGQLGGLECSAEARLMLAEESRARWCRECGKTNDQMLAQQRETHKATVWALKHGPGNVLGRAAAVTAAAGNGESSAATITAATTGNGDAPYAPNVFPSRTASSHLRLDQQSPRNQQTSGLDWMIGGFLIFLMLMVYNKYA